MRKFAKLPSARNSAFEHSLVCFYPTDKRTCTNKDNLIKKKTWVFFLSTKCLTLFSVTKMSDNKVNHLSTSAFQSSVQKEPWLLNTFEEK